MYHSQTSQNNYPLAVTISAIVFGAFLLLSFLYIISQPFDNEQLGTGGVLVNYGTVDVGMGNDINSIEEPNQAPEANQKLPDEVVPPTPVQTQTSPTSTTKEVVTQDNRDAPEVNVKKTSQVKTQVSAKTKSPEKAAPAVNQNALYKGPANNSMGRGDGDGNKPGNQGSVNGDPLATKYGPGGSGFGNKPIELRRFTNLVIPQDDGQKTGRVAVRIYINASGQVINAVPGVKGTTLSDADLWEKCRKAVMGASLTTSASGQEQQVGTVIFNFKVK